MQLIEVEVPIRNSKFPAYGEIAQLDDATRSDKQLVRLLATSAAFDVHATNTVRERYNAWIEDHPADGGPPKHHPASSSTKQLHDGIQRYHAQIVIDQRPTGKLTTCHPRGAPQ